MTATLRPPPAAPTSAPPGAARPSPSPGASAGGVTNLALTLLTLAAVFGVARLFTHPMRFFGPVAVVAVSVHVTAWLCRRVNLSVVPAGAACALVGALTISWISVGQTTAYGIPWRGTYHAVGPALRAAADAYRSTSAPTALLPGFLIAGGVGAAFAAYLSDWAAFRMRATTEAVLPSFSLFVLSAALAQGHVVVGAGGLWLGALLVFLLVRQAAVDSPSTAWFASRSRRGPATILVVGGVMTVATVSLTSALAPHLPGATTHPMVDWRHSGSGGSGGGRNTLSPLVDLTARLHALSDQEVFTVQTTQPGYLRITALSTFSGSGWSLDDTYRPVHDELPLVDNAPGSLPADAGPTETVTDTVHITNLESLWLPAAYRPVRVTGASGVSYSAAAASIITSKPTSDGLSYTVTSHVPTANVAQLEAAAWPDPGRADLQKYLELTANVPSIVKRLAQTHTEGAKNPYAAARMLQDWLRSRPFTYSLDVPADQSQNALVDFLTRTRAGFCQQFAAAFAVLAREIGLPSRVAVGFTEGDRDSAGLYHVRDADAHAWPEVWFDGVGWVAFEPTPGRGSPDPSAQAVTGVPPGQAETSTTPTTQASPTTSIAGSATTSPTTPRPVGGAQQVTTGAGGHQGWRTPALLVVGGLVVAALAWVALLTALGAAVTRRRRRAAHTASSQVTLAWSLAGEALAGAGLPPHPWETPSEFAARVAAGPGALDCAGAVQRLAALEELAAYSPLEPSAEDVAAAEAAEHEIAAAARASRRWWSELGRRWDPRPVLAAAMSARTEARAGAAADRHAELRLEPLEELSPRA